MPSKELRQILICSRSWPLSAPAMAQQGQHTTQLIQAACTLDVGRRVDVNAVEVLLLDSAAAASRHLPGSCCIPATGGGHGRGGCLRMPQALLWLLSWTAQHLLRLLLPSRHLVSRCSSRRAGSIAKLLGWQHVAGCTWAGGEQAQATFIATV